MSASVLPSDLQPDPDSQLFRDAIERAHNGSLMLLNLSMCQYYRVDEYSHDRMDVSVTKMQSDTSGIKLNYQYVASRLHFGAMIQPNQTRLDQF